MAPDYSNLRGNVSFLGRLLGETIAAADGDEFLALIERIRGLSKRAREVEKQEITIVLVKLSRVVLT